MERNDVLDLDGVEAALGIEKSEVGAGAFRRFPLRAVDWRSGWIHQRYTRAVTLHDPPTGL